MGILKKTKEERAWPKERLETGLGILKETKEEQSWTQGETRNWIEDIKGNERRAKLGQWRDYKRNWGY